MPSPIKRKLQDVGVDARVAQTHAEPMEEFVVSDLVTKEHLASKLAQLEAKFETKLADVELRVVRWVVGSVGVAAVGIVVTILVAMLRLPK